MPSNCRPVPARHLPHGSSVEAAEAAVSPRLSLGGRDPAGCPHTGEAREEGTGASLAAIPHSCLDVSVATGPPRSRLSGTVLLQWPCWDSPNQAQVRSLSCFLAVLRMTRVRREQSVALKDSGKTLQS